MIVVIFILLYSFGMAFVNYWISVWLEADFSVRKLRINVVCRITVKIRANLYFIVPIQYYVFRLFLAFDSHIPLTVINISLLLRYSI